MDQFEKLDLSTIDDGEAVQQVDHLLNKAIENCLDPNTVPNANREITLTIKIKPTEDREKANLEYSVKSKFPGDAPGSATILIHRGKKQGWVSAAQQMDLEDMITKRDLDSGVETLIAKGTDQ